IERATGTVDDALDGAGIPVAGVPAQPHGRVAERGAQRLVDDGRRTFLDELLIAPLDRAVAFAQVQDGFAVGEDLHFDVPHAGEIFFDVDRAVAERRLRFACGVRVGGRQFALVADEANAAAAATR